LKYYKFD